MKKLRIIDRGRWPCRFPALALAGALCLVMTSPALADFESAVAAYEAGAYREAQIKFEALAAAGDKRAEPYLEGIREILRGDPQAGGAATSTLKDSIASILAEPEASSDGSQLGTILTEAGPATAGRSPDGIASGKPADWEPWSPFAYGTELAPSPVSNVVFPERRSIWSIILHLPADATVVGLQYVAKFLGADDLSRELQSMSRHEGKTSLSILAGFWWLVIIKVLIGLGAAIGRLMKAATTLEEQRRYG